MKQLTKVTELEDYLDLIELLVLYKIFFFKKRKIYM